MAKEVNIPLGILIRLEKDDYKKVRDLYLYRVSVYFDLDYNMLLDKKWKK